MDAVSSWTGSRADALREALRMTNESFAEHLGVAVRTVAYWRNRPEMVPQPAIQEVLDAALARASDQAKAQFRLLLNDKSVSRKEANRPTSLQEWLTSTATGDGAIEEIARAAVSLAETHTRLPARKTLFEVLRLQRQAQTLLENGRMRFRQTRELLKVNADLLAHACILYGDLNEDLTAEQYGATALLFAQEAGASEAAAWYARSKTARWQDKYLEAADLARQGFERSPRAPIRVQLAYYEANAAALLGDSIRARDALKRGEEAAESSFAPEAGISVWSFPTQRMALFALSVATRTQDPHAALRAAQTAEAGWESGDPRVPTTWAQIKVGSAIARLMQGDLDGAVTEVTPMLTLEPEFRVATVTRYLAQLDQRLRHPKFQLSRAAVDLRQQIREFNSIALPQK